MSEKEPASPLEHVAAPGEVLCGKYRVERVIGAGGMGVVVEAWHLQFEERVAIKFLLPDRGANSDAVARFEREARVLFKIKSPHVCRVLDVAKLDNGTPFMVMEFLEGEDLASRLTRREGSPIEDAVDYIVQACDAVGEAHARGIVHRDLKPENLFLSRGADGAACIKVIDFGLSKIAASEHRQPRQRTLTASEQALGTPHYMSPEQWVSARNVAPASDQWALAVILYELIAGVPPFDGEQLAQICSQVLHGPMPSLAALCPQVPLELEQTLRRALEKDPSARFMHLGQFAAAIAAFGRVDSRAIAERISRIFDQAEPLSLSGQVARVEATSGAFGNLGAGLTPSQPSRDGVSGLTPLPGPLPGPLAATPGLETQPALAVLPAPALGPQRAHTAQNWQQQLVQPPSQSGSRVAPTVAIVLAALATLCAVGAFVVYPRFAGDSRVKASGEPAAIVDARTSDIPRGDPSETAVASASPAPSASASSAPADVAPATTSAASSSPSPWRPPAPTKPGVAIPHPQRPTVPAPPPPHRKPPSKPDLFGER